MTPRLAHVAEGNNRAHLDIDISGERLEVVVGYSGWGEWSPEFNTVAALNEPFRCSPRQASVRHTIRRSAGGPAREDTRLAVLLTLDMPGPH